MRNRDNILIIILTLIIIFFIIILIMINIRNNISLNEEETFINVHDESVVNTWNYRVTSDEDIVSIYFNKYIETMSINIENSYYLLNKEYREKKFKDINEYYDYIENNKDILKTMAIEKYKVKNYDNYKQYILKNQNGNYYIINEKAIMQFDLILDTYTLDLPEFIEKYDKGNDEEKIQLNVNKLIEAINNKDYKYVYNKLDDTFRKNNFNNISTFENYIKNNFYEKSKISNFSYRQEGSVYICTLEITNKENTSQGTKSITILIKLLENRDFDISFSL